MVVDRDVSNQTIYFNNLQGQSFSNVLQTELNIALTKRFDYRLTYKLMDVEAELNQQVQQQLMVQKHRWLSNLSFKSLNKKWESNITGVLNGKMRLKMAPISNDPKTFNTTSSMYATINAQITYIYKKWDFYIGGENLTNYTQKNVIIDAQNPFGSYFDATMVWAPIYGITVYGGIRYKLKHIPK